VGEDVLDRCGIYWTMVEDVSDRCGVQGEDD